MNFITHSLLPVTIKQYAEIKSKDKLGFSRQWKGWVAIALFGTLPDLLDFHMTVVERWTSYSHQWPMTAAFFSAGWICFALFRKHYWARIAPWCGTAYALHIPCDIVSGGLDFFKTGNVIGAWWISFLAWPAIDITLIVLFCWAQTIIRKRHGLKLNPLRKTPPSS
jgi:hypothetical protein